MIAVDKIITCANIMDSIVRRVVIVIYSAFKRAVRAYVARRIRYEIHATKLRARSQPLSESVVMHLILYKERIALSSRSQIRQQNCFQYYHDGDKITEILQTKQDKHVGDLYSA
nr:hypothetical protein CFP56_20607 [Quercus suber]